MNLRGCPQVDSWKSLELLSSKTHVLNQWPFQNPKLEVPTIYKAYVREYPQKIWPYMVQCLHFRILKFTLTWGSFELSHMCFKMSSRLAAPNNIRRPNQGTSAPLPRSNASHCVEQCSGKMQVEQPFHRIYHYVAYSGKKVADPSVRPGRSLTCTGVCHQPAIFWTMTSGLTNHTSWSGIGMFLDFNRLDE